MRLSRGGIAVEAEDDGSPEITLGGRFMTFNEDEEGTAHLAFDDNGTGRRCGSCTLCCKLLPVVAVNKGAGERCRHASHAKGCRIYPDRPFECKSWSCRWLADPRTKGMPRPDRCHYVIDIKYDTITLQNNDTGEKRHSPVLQVWVDPAYPDAHRAPELRAYMGLMADKYRAATLIRWDSARAMIIYPPSMHTGEGFLEWRDATVMPGADYQRMVQATSPPAD